MGRCNIAISAARVRSPGLNEASGRNARPVASVTTKTISDFTALRKELKIPEPV